MLGELLVAMDVPDTASKRGEGAAAWSPFVGIDSGAAGFISGVCIGLGGESGNVTESFAALVFLYWGNTR
jgi:hypothetical protein